jgi:hypothetical protein
MVGFYNTVLSGMAERRPSRLRRVHLRRLDQHPPARILGGLILGVSRNLRSVHTPRATATCGLRGTWLLVLVLRPQGLWQEAPHGVRLGASDFVPRARTAAVWCICSSRPRCCPPWCAAEYLLNTACWPASTHPRVEPQHHQTATRAFLLRQEPPSTGIAIYFAILPRRASA